jgi:hypothetical protein
MIADGPHTLQGLRDQWHLRASASSISARTRTLLACAEALGPFIQRDADRRHCPTCDLSWSGPYTDCPGCQAQAGFKAVSDLQQRDADREAEIARLEAAARFVLDTFVRDEAQGFQRVQITKRTHPHFEEYGRFTGKVIKFPWGEGHLMAEVKLEHCRHGTDGCFVSRGDVRIVSER